MVVTIQRDEPIAVITLNRPDVLNAIDASMLDELADTLITLKGDDSIRVVMLTGAGDKAFAAGADIGELAAQTATGGREFALRGQRVFDLVEGLATPWAVAVNWRWPARSGWRPTPRNSVSRKSRWASFPGTPDRSGWRGWSAKRKRWSSC